MSRNQIIAIKRVYQALVDSGNTRVAEELNKAFPELFLPECI